MAEVIHRYIGKSGKLPPGPSKDEQRRKNEKTKLDAQFVASKTEQVNVRTMQSAMTLALRRGELIETELVVKQAAYLLVALRQKILAIPQAYSRRLLGINDAKVMQGKLKEMSLSMLEELRHLRERVTDPHWLETVEEDGCARLASGGSPEGQISPLANAGLPSIESTRRLAHSKPLNFQASAIN